jgi:hypothetical protein
MYEMYEWLIAGFASGVGLIIAWSQTRRPRWLRVAFLCAGIALAVGSPLAAGALHWYEAQKTSGVATPYPPTVLDCFVDARGSQYRTFIQSTLPADVVYVWRGHSQETTPGEIQTRDSLGSLLQLSGMFIQCSLRNKGDKGLNDLTLTFHYLFAPQIVLNPFDLHGQLLPKGLSRTSLVVSPVNPPVHLEAEAHTAFLAPYRSFNFAIINFDNWYGFLGFPYSGFPPQPLSYPVSPELSYSLDSTVAATSHQPLKLTCRAHNSLEVAMVSAEKSDHPWTFADKCAQLFLNGFNFASREAHKLLSNLPNVCRKYQRILDVSYALNDCSI